MPKKTKKALKSTRLNAKGKGTKGTRRAKKTKPSTFNAELNGFKLILSQVEAEALKASLDTMNYLAMDVLEGEHSTEDKKEAFFFLEVSRGMSDKLYRSMTTI